MITQIKRWLEPLHFARNDEKNIQVRVINLLIVNLGIVLLAAIFILVPLFVVQKIEAWILLGILFLGVAIGGVLINRGYLRLGTPIIVSTAWICFLLLTLVSGGPANPTLFFLASTTLIVGFILGNRFANGLTLLTVLTALGIIFLRSRGLALPLMIEFTPLTGWLAFGLGLVFMNSIQNIFVHNLENANTKARQEIVARRQIEQSLQESEARYKSLFENNHAVMLIIDPTSATIVDANPAACAYYGWSRTEMLNKKVASINILTETEILAEMQLAGSEKRNHFYFKHRRADGSIRDVEIYSGPLVQTGKTLLYSIVHDITDRKQTEEALSESEAKFRSLIEQSSDGVVLIDEQMKVIEWNPAQEIITGIPRLEAIGTPYWEIQYRILPPERQAQRSPEYFQKAMTAAFVNGQIPQTGTSTEVLIQTAGGESKSIFQVSFPIRTETGYRIGAVVRDVTERKKAEDSLQSTTLRLTSLLEHMQTGILFEDLQRHVALTNQAFCDLFNIPMPAKSLVGTDCREAMQSSKQLMSAPEEFVQKTEQMVNKNEPLSNEELSLADGRTFERDYIPISLGNQLTGHLWQYRDITERKRAEAAVRESEEKFRLSFMTGMDAFYISRLEDGQCIETNQVFEDVFGYTRDEIIGKTALQLDIYQNPADRATMISELGAKGYIKDREIKGKKKNGEIITISLSINLVLINNQKHILGVIRDITKRKRVEEHLELLNYSIDTSPDGAYWFNPEGSFLYVNESGCKSLGYTLEELSHLRIFDINLRLTPERWAEVWQIIKEKKVFTIESVHHRKDGSEFPVEITSTYVKFGALEYCNGFARDITARKLTEQTLLENEEHFRAVVQTANDAIITIDSSGMIVAWNTAAEMIFGYSTNDAVGMPVSRITPTHFIDPHVQGIEGAMGSKDRQIVGKTVEIFGLAKDGREFPIEMSLAEWKTQAGQFFTAIMRDTSERKQREKELHAIACLSAALRTAPTRAEMLPVIVEQLSSLLNCDSTSAEIIDPITNEAVVEAACGVWTPLINSRQPSGTGLNAIIQRTRQGYHNNNLKDDARIGFPFYLLENIIAGAGVPLIAQDQLIGFLWMGKKKEIAESEVRLLAAVADIAANALYRATLHERTQQDAANLTLAYNTTLEGWAHALELRDQETVGHTRRVVQMTVDLAGTMNIGEGQLENLRRGALLHDIGKMGIPDSVLLKPGTLNDREWEIMRRHPEYANQFLEPIEYLRPALSIPYCHHEKWDGSGYPRGLKGEEIPLEARIFAIVDVWDALRSDRPYRTAWTSEKARQYIIEQEGIHFDPQVVQNFLEMLGNE